MKKTLLVLCSLAFSAHLQAQKLELTLQAAAGSFHYSGPSQSSDAVSFEPVTGYPGGPKFYSTTNNLGTSYSYAVQVQWVYSKGFIIGLQTGYERYKSNLSIVQDPTANSTILFTKNIEYTTPKSDIYLQNQFIDINPYVGHRLSLKDFSLDILPGIEIAANTSSYTKGTYLDNTDDNFTTNNKRADIATDFRLKLAAAVYYKRFGLSASYAYGLTDYKKYHQPMADPYNARTRLFKFGINCRIF